MNIYNHKISLLVALLLGVAGQSVHAQTVNMWRGSSGSADWNDSYKWKLNHPPADGEAAHFRADNTIISVNNAVQMNNGIYLYGQELQLKGNGSINLGSVIPLERTVNIPASTTGYANLTLRDTFSLNGRISLSAKGFGTSECKGTITLKDRSTVTGDLAIGNKGVGTGQVYVMDNATFRITSLKLDTKADMGGMAEIHIMGGTVRIDTDDDFFGMFMADPSRRIILGESGTLRIDSSLSLAKKKDVIKQLIANNRLVPAPGFHLSTPILQKDMMIARAEESGPNYGTGNVDTLLANIDKIPESTPVADTVASSDVGELVKALQTEVDKTPITIAHAGKSAETEKNMPHMAGYIVFVGALLLTLRRPA